MIEVNKMKVVILAGGLGTRISEESHLKPKPMIEIGGKPILWHIMKCYSYYGFNEFIICAGYKQEVIKDYFANYYIRNCDVTFDLSNNENVLIHNSGSEDWKVTVVDTGLSTMTGGRIKRIKKYLNNETFMLTYGDGVSDIDIRELVKFHKKNKKMVTMTAVQPDGRFGVIEMDADGNVHAFREKSKGDSGWINVGFMVCEPKMIDYIEGDSVSYEEEPLTRIANEGELVCYRHNGFWQCMDTLRDKEKLERLISEGKAPWMIWKK